MGVSKKEEEILFTECKESVEDVFGWKIVIFLPQATAWKVLIMITVLISFVITTIKVFYFQTNKIFYGLEALCDGIYFLDVMLATLHFGLSKTRKLRHGERRLFIFLLIDIISLIPLNLLFEYLIYKEGKKQDKLNYILRANIILRSYQVFKGFADIKKTVCSIKIFYILSFVEVLTYFGLITHFFSCIIFENFDKNQKQRCLNDFALCVLENDLLTFTLLDHNYVPPFSKYPLKDYKFLLMAEFVVGFIFIYGFITPLTIYINISILREFFEYYAKRKQLSLLNENMIEEKVLKRKLTNYFHYEWTYGKGDNLPEIINLFPLSFRKTIFCDIHWDALRHSEFLQSLSVGCKRSLSLRMTTEFVLPKTVLYQKDQPKTSFTYLESGLIQIITEENNESPIMNLSDGTVLGEISLFYQTESKAEIRAGKFSIIHVLKCVDLYRVLLHYPEDMKKLRNKLKIRMKIARALCKNKTEIVALFKHDLNYAQTLTNMKWMKYQFRALVKLEKWIRLNAVLQPEVNQATDANFQRLIQTLETQLEHTSMYISLLCINDDGEKAYDVVCLNVSFPWFLDPDIHFLNVWNSMINAVVIIVVMVYPLFLGWYPFVPEWFYNVAVVVNLIYIVDALIIFFTAIKIQGVVVFKLSTVVNQKFSTLSFYLDLLAAFPFYLLSYFNKNLQGRFHLNLLMSNTLLKSYKLFPILNKLTYSAKPGTHYRACVKFVLTLYFSAYWSAAILNLIGVECIFYECKKQNWFPEYQNQKKGEHYKAITSVFVALLMVLEMPIKTLQANELPTFVVYFVLNIISNFLHYAWKGECVACYVLEYSQELEYRGLMELVKNFMIEHKISGMVIKRVMETLEFQWLYDKGNYITQKRRILENLPINLRDEVDRKFLLPILQKSRLFKWEDDEFFVDLCRRASRLAVPANSLLLTFGTQTMVLYVIHKGYVQVNSFVVGDLHLNISTPLVFKSGDTFPVLVAFSQIPASITAITLTDCELLTLDLEDILTVMITHKVFPNVVQALQELDLTAMAGAKLGLSRIRSNFKLDKRSYVEPFYRLKSLGTFLKYFFIKSGIDFRSKIYLCWETFRNLLILFNLIMWPLVFGCCCKSENKLLLIRILLGLDGASSLIDFYLRLNLSYYNKMGIYVVHPLITFLHYLSSSFLLDLLAFVPNFHMIHLIKKNRLNFSVSIVIVHMLMRSLSLYRTVGLYNYITYSLEKYLNIIKLVKWFFFGILGMHYYINLMVYFYVEGIAKPEMSFSPNRQLQPKKPYEYYFYELSLTLSILLQGQIFFNIFSIYNLVKIAILGIMAMLNQTFILSVLTLNVTSSSSNFTLYQYYFRSFVKFLKKEKVDDNISAQAIKYFEFKWQKYKGMDMKKIFSNFPYTLHEDILFPLYKDTLRGVRSLSKANEAFYRALSRNVEVISLMAASVIIFQNQAQGDIFFIHKGKCFVEENFKILVKGAVFGDIQNRGLMKRTIKALTHVDVLRISSKLFFVIIGNFYSTKKAFELEVAAADDFLESVYIDPQKGNFIKIEPQRNTEELSEVEFEAVNHNLENTLIRPLKVKKKMILLNPNSFLVRMLNFIFFMDAYITCIVIPIFIGSTLLTWWALTIIYCLDAIWIINICLTTRTTLIDSKTGNYTYERKRVVLNYLRKFDGMILHILSVLPLELTIIAYYWETISYQHCDLMYYCYGNRLFRIPHLYYNVNSRMKELLTNIYFKLLNIAVIEFAVINLFASLNLLLRRGKDFSQVTCTWGARKSQLDDVINSYYYVMNHYIGSGVTVGLPETRLEIVFELLIEVWALLSKGLIVTQVLVIIYVTHFTKMDHLLKLQQLEKYLSIRDVSPSLLLKMQKYSCNLLNTYKEGAHPTFLKEAPTFIQTAIMQELYMQHLSDCNIFQGVDEIFLKQLVVRLERFIFFPGDYVVEKGDVDHNMYFIHKGEVKCVEIDEKYPVLERTVDLFVSGECFGVMQGIFFSCPHENTFRAKVLTDVLVLNYYKWGDLRAAFPEITQKIYKTFQQMGKKSNEK